MEEKTLGPLRPVRTGRRDVVTGSSLVNLRPGAVGAALLHGVACDLRPGVAERIGSTE